MQAFMNALSPGYFETMGIKLLEGRDFRATDIVENPKIAIVNRKFAQHFFGDKSAIGRRLGRGMGPETKLDIEIIGVVEDSLYEGPREGVRRQVFWPGYGGSSTFYVRTTEASASAFNIIRSEVKRLDAGMPVYDVKTVQGQLDETLLTDRLIALLSAGFGLLATVLASVGLYGVMAFIVARRRKEIGLRLALGAEPSGVLWIVMREVLILLVDRSRRRRARGDRTGPLRVVAALRDSAERSVDGDRHGVAVDGGLRGGGPDSRDEGEPDRSDSGAEIRVRSA